MQRSDERFERLQRESDRRHQEQLQLTREVIRRNELAFREGSRVLGELVEVIKDIREETRAHTQAILTVLDRLDNGGAAAQ
jgi:hypothetical protein